MRQNSDNYSIYEIIELYKENLISKMEARYLVCQVTKVYFPKDFPKESEQ